MLHQVGAGTLGPVFRAYDSTEGRLVAIKAFRLDLIPERAAEFASALNALAGRGLDHPSIAAPIAAGVEGTAPWLAQTYVPAESLDSAFRQYGRPPLADGIAMVIALAGALDVAAGAGVLHGALHPRDVLIAPDDTRVIDLGVAAALEGVGLRAPVRRPYAAPERIEGGPVTRAADVFSLGAIAFEIVTGQRVTGAGDDAVAELPDIPGANREALVDTFAFALSAAPDERFTTALGFASALKRALGDALAQSPPSAPPPEPAAPVVVAAPAVAAPTVPPAAELQPGEAPGVDEAILPLPAPAKAKPRAPRSRSAARTDRSDAHAPAPVDAPGPPDAAPVEAPLAPPPAVPLEHVEFRAATDDGAPRWEEQGPVPPSQPAPDGGAEHAPIAVPPRSSGGFVAISLPLVAGVFVLGALVGLGLGWLFFGRGAGSAERTASGGAAPAAPVAASTSMSVPEPAPRTTIAPPRAEHEGMAPQVAGPSTPSPTPGAAKPASAARPPTPPPAKARAPAAAPVRGQLVVRSTPAGARVEVNGRVRGQTPLTLRDLPLGALTVRVIRDGYGTELRRITLTATRASQALDVPLSRTPAAAELVGFLFVETRPAGARVFLDGRQVGTSPLDVPKVAAGSHVVRLELDGFKRWSASITVVAGERSRVAASLEEVGVR